MNKGMDIKEIEKRMESVTDWYVDNCEFLDDMKFMLSTIKSLQTERDKYKEALTAISRGLFSARNAQAIAQSALKEE